MIKFFVIVISFISLITYGQRSNVANINTVSLWNKMQEKSSADSLLYLQQIEYSEYYNELLMKYETGINSLQKDTTSNGLILKQKQEDIQVLENKIKEYRLSAENELKIMKDNLYGPIRKKMLHAVNSVADKLKYDYVIDTSFGNIIYTKNEKDNILNDVLDQLNIKY
jgi:Skp family chaperone for outer membrane proteins